MKLFGIGEKTTVLDADGEPLSLPEDCQEKIIGSESTDTFASNFDYTHDEGIAEQMKIEPCCSKYAGWNFNALICWSKSMELYLAEVWQYRAHVETFCAPTVPKLMKLISDKYGRK